MNIACRPFGTLADGSVVTCWTLTNDTGLKVEVLDYGVTIRSLVLPDQTGNPVDIVLGYDTLEEYTSQDGCLGATVGRYANRIGKGVFTLNGKEYHLAVNNGPNHLHGGLVGFDKKIWTSIQTRDSLAFTLLSPDGEEGYPGNLAVTVTIRWEGNDLQLRYHAITDRDTILNLTNHTYFNLKGQGKGNVHDHLLKVHADAFTLNDADCLPTGQVVPVEGTAMDFREEKLIGQDVDSDEPCVKLSRGYDSNFILHSKLAAVVRSPESGISMTVYTDQPGVQLYTANFLTDRPGKDGAHYSPRSGFCLETQHYPDSIHHPEWPTCILHAGEAFDSFTTFAFRCKLPEG